MLPGTFTGRDEIIARIGYGEMILNPSQIRSVISRVGGMDPFPGIVPNYKTPNPQPQGSFATGGFVAPVAAPAPVVVQPIIEIHISEQEFSEIVYKANQSEQGKRELFKLINNGINRTYDIKIKK
jgi:hypothetical protein